MTAHASFELTHHVVLATRFRRGVFGVLGPKIGEAPVNYRMKVAAARGFALDQATILPDHVHLLVRITPNMSIDDEQQTASWDETLPARVAECKDRSDMAAISLRGNMRRVDDRDAGSVSQGGGSERGRLSMKGSTDAVGGIPERRGKTASLW